MKKKIILTIILFLLVMVAIGFVSNFSLLGFNGESQVIIISDEGFQPSSLTIKPGTKIIFKNTGSRPRWPASDFHPTHGIYPEFDPLEGIQPGKQWSFRFGKAGKWKYHDHIEPQLKGEVIVK
jgi:plastocyanin